MFKVINPKSKKQLPKNNYRMHKIRKFHKVILTKITAIKKSRTLVHERGKCKKITNARVNKNFKSM